MALHDTPEDLSSWTMPGGFVYDGVAFGAAPFSPVAIDRIKEADVPHYDVLVATFPRSGTARLVEICWLLLHDCDVETAKVVDGADRHMFLEWMCMPGPSFDLANNPGVAKTHLDYKSCEKLVELGRKVIVGIRNPKDTLTSFYHFNKMLPMLGSFPGNWRQYMECYKKNVFEYGDYFDNVLSWWDQRHRDNIMIVRYEDLNKKPGETIKEMDAFLGTGHSEAKLETVAEWVAFSNMSTQITTNFKSEKYKEVVPQITSDYMRKGKVGDSKNSFTEEDHAYIDELCEKRCKPQDLTFQFE